MHTTFCMYIFKIYIDLILEPIHRNFIGSGDEEKKENLTDTMT